MQKIFIAGTIDNTHTNVSGQYDRTEIIKNALEKKGYSITFVNMICWHRNPFSLLISIVCGYYRCDAFIFLASANGTKVILNLLSLLMFFKKKKVFQITIGGLRNFLFVKNSTWYRARTRKLSAVFLEVKSMVSDYKTLGLNNVYYLPNCKKINIDENAVNNSRLSRPYRFCTYSRVTPDKGIVEAVDVVENLNEKYGKYYCTLDIYGTYLEEDRVWFENLMKKASDAISFKGRIDRKYSVSTLSQYDLMLFPTQHVGEGVPGGVIDCYEAALPIVTCDTSYMKNIVHDNKTGFVYSRSKSEALQEAILRYTEDADIQTKKQFRKNCQSEAMQYNTDYVMNVLYDIIVKQN